MPKPSKKKQVDDIKINEAIEPEINDFVRIPVPSEKEAKAFEEEVVKEVKESEIDESLSEIYQDEAGEIEDVSRLKIEKSNVFSWMFGILLMLGLVGGSMYAAYNYIFLGGGNTGGSVEFKIEGMEEVVAGEEFFYTLTYSNPGRVSLSNATINIKYPDSFVLLDAEENITKGAWNFDTIDAGYAGIIKIKGKVIAEKDSSGIAIASFSYTPSNFNSEFKKESSFVSLVNDIGLEIDTDYPTPVLAGEDSELIIKVKPKDKNFLKNFRISIDPLENIEFLDIENEENRITQIRGGVYEIFLTEEKEEEFIVPIKFTEKVNDKEELVLTFSQIDENDMSRTFYSNILEVEVINSDLNLTLILNGSKVDNGIDFGGKLNYSLVYSNKGETELKDVVIMAILESELLDWGSLEDVNEGSVDKDSISWSKKEIARLASLDPRDEGMIDFSIDVLNPDEIEQDVKYEINTYAQYSIGTSSDESHQDNSDLRSNTIVTSINSNLEISEELRYFNDDNIAVGSGPLPPKVGETTSFRVYWKIENGLHDLENVLVKIKLPENVKFSQGENLSIGSLDYNTNTNELSWIIENLPITTEIASADFKIELTPREEDGDKILVILPASTITATDTVTGEGIMKETVPKTSRLEDDPIADIDGIIE